MPNSSISIIFSELALTRTPLIGTSIKFNYVRNNNLEVTENFVSLRTSPYQSSVDDGDIRENLIYAINLDYPNIFEAELLEDNAIVLRSILPDAVFSNIIDSDLVTYLIRNETQPTNPNELTVKGLESDNYFINNEVNFEIAANFDVQYYKIKISNLTDQLSASDKIAYPNGSFATTIGIAPIVKSLFSYPQDANGYIINSQPTSNANKYRVQIFYNTTLSVENEVLGFEAVKNFIRGGRLTTETNQTITGILTPTEKLPVWQGYETAEYFLDEAGVIRKRLLLDVALTRIDSLRTKGCNGLYLKFKNSNGGYSNWLFDNHTINNASINLGGFVRDNYVDDLGNNIDGRVSVSGKVSAEYIVLIDHLIASEEIYYIKDGKQVRIRNKGNSLAINANKRSQQVTLNFDIDYRYTPSLIWSN